VRRADRAAWRSARTLADLGELVTRWPNGQLQQTPGHLGPPCAETIPLIAALTAANRAGFVTDNSQQAGRDGARVWEAWVCGFATDDTLARLRAAVAGTPLILDACRGRVHGGHRWGRCPRREVTGFWLRRCPGASRELAVTWHVTITDPAPGRNDRLWPALDTFAATPEGMS
jgi:hypothetical protein